MKKLPRMQRVIMAKRSVQLFADTLMLRFYRVPKFVISKDNADRDLNDVTFCVIDAVIMN